MKATHQVLPAGTAPSGAQTLLITGLILLVISAGWLSEQWPVRYVFVVFAGLASVVLAVVRRSILPLAAAPLAIAATMYFALYPSADPAINDRVFRLFVLFPAMFVVGVFWLNTKSRRREFARIYLWVAVLMSPIAFVERLTGGSLLDRAIPVNLLYGEMRAFLLTEHTLVLAVLLVLAVPMAMTVRRMGGKVALITVLATGIWSTASDGCLALLVIIVGVECLLRAGNMGTRARAAAYRAVFAIFALALILPGLVAGSQPIVTSADSDVASFEYRYALYAVLPKTLETAPFGWGVEGLPTGVFYTPSQFGTLDVARTVDSELVYAAIDFGWPGLLAFLTAVWTGTSSRLLSDPVGRMAVLLTACGMFLALHAWTGLGSLWFLLLGGCVAALRDGSESSLLEEGTRRRMRGRDRRHRSLRRGMGTTRFVAASRGYTGPNGIG